MFRWPTFSQWSLTCYCHPVALACFLSVFYSNVFHLSSRFWDLPGCIFWYSVFSYSLDANVVDELWIQCLTKRVQQLKKHKVTFFDFEKNVRKWKRTLLCTVLEVTQSFQVYVSKNCIFFRKFIFDFGL